MYCLTLRNSPREPHVERELCRVGLHAVELLQHDRDHVDGRRGCWAAHLSALRRGLDAGHEAIVVFEDDCCFWQRGSVGVAGLVEEALSLARRHPHAIVGLGGMAMGAIGATMGKSTRFRRGQYACTHAYVMGAAAARQVIKWEYTGAHIDHELMRLCGSNMVLAVPTVAFQQAYLWDATTTDTASWVYYARTMARNLLGPVAFQVMLEYYWRFVGWLMLVGELMHHSWVG